MVKKDDQIQFYSEELKELEFSIKKTFNATGLSLFQNGDIYVGQYKGLDEKRGNVFVDIPSGEQYHAPRLDQKLTCVTLQPGLERPSNWSNITYSDLLKDRNCTEAKIIDYIPSKRDGWITMLIREMDFEFIENLQYNQILAFGPTVPPFEYLQNLKDFSESICVEEESLWSKILSFQYSLNRERLPRLITEEIDIPKSIIEEVNKYNIYLFQGPPGTGKTHQIADVISRLVLENQSVLVTALTNKAAMEVCEKPFFNKLFEEQRVSKLMISIDERKKFPLLLNDKNLVPIKGHLILTTYYQFSRIWEAQTQTFDYVVVEEASQAYLTTIAAACKVGKRVIVVGDPKQIVPIVTNKNYRVFQNIDLLINGMNTLSQIDQFSFNRKIETRRLTERSVEFTNSFYKNTIQSKSIFGNINEDIEKFDFLSKYTHPNGGPSLLLFPNNTNLLNAMLIFLVNSINEFSKLKGNEIAVLTPYIETLTYLQQNLKSKTNFRNYLIESVDRIQGLDVDYCFYVIPKSSSFSFNTNRFNVATSRAKKATYILAERNFIHLVNLPSEVDHYLSKFNKEFCFLIESKDLTYENSVLKNVVTTVDISDNKNEEDLVSPSKKNVSENHDDMKLSTNTIGLKVIGKIDISKFERPKKEIRKDKNNLYIIDTNVFIDFPFIISKIEQGYPVILSAKVLDELDKLKITLNIQGKSNIQKALKSINQNIDNRDIRLYAFGVARLAIFRESLQYSISGFKSINPAGSLKYCRESLVFQLFLTISKNHWISNGVVLGV